MKTISATKNTYKVSVKAYNKETKDLYTTTVEFCGTYDEKRKAKIRQDFIANNELICKFYDDTLAISNSAKYIMPVDTFFGIAVKMDKRPVGDYISRTAYATKYSVTLYDNYADDILTEERYAVGKNAEKAVKDIAKLYKGTDKTVLEIEPIATTEALYVMEASKFFYLATKVEE